MKAGILTMHKVLNCGSALQAYALQRKLDSLGCSSEIIDYRYEDKSRRWASDRRDAVFLRENGEELTIPAPVTKSFDEQEPLRAATAAKPDDAMEITYYPKCKTVVSVRPL